MPNWMTRIEIQAGLANNKVICASTFWPGQDGTGIVDQHVYAVIGFNANTDRVRLYNPWGRNPDYFVAAPGAAGLETRNRSGPTEGGFEMSLDEFCSLFISVNRER